MTRTFLAGILMLASASLWAQEGEQAPPPQIFPVEIYACTFNEGRGPTDLDMAVEAWNTFMDEQGVEYYFAATMTPHYYGPDTFDFAWLGAWSDAEKMGSGTDMWLAEGGEHAQKFASVATCNVHVNFATMSVRQPPEENPDDNFVLQFQDCNVHEGTSMSDAFAAIGKFTAYQDEMGYAGGTWAMFPAYGDGNADFDMKMVDGFSNHKELGQNYEKFANGGGYQKHGEIVGPVMSCDEARVYNAKTRRRMTNQ
ncbi:MAG: hypothetical protein QNJ00_02230 [Woeseiaceae bacterium]|nr:hypothetical protein [Woeseiaceae bacterium]